MSDATRLTFRISPWRPWSMAVIVLAIVAAVVAVAVAAAGPPGAWWVPLVMLGVAAVILLLLIGLAARFSRWDADAAGVGGPDNYLVYHRVAWDEIASLSRVPIPGYPFVWVNTAARRRLFWVPLFLTDMAAFRSVVARSAAPGNPLRQHLEGRLA